MKLEFGKATEFDENSRFNIVVTRSVLRQGVLDEFSEVVATEVTWLLANKCVHGILTGIGKPDINQWKNIKDVYLEPMIPQQHSLYEDPLGKYIREEIREENLRLRSELGVSFNAKIVDQVASGTFQVERLFI